MLHCGISFREMLMVFAVMVARGDPAPHRGDPPAFVVRASADAEGAVHDRSVGVALEAIGPLLQLHAEAVRPGEVDRRQDAVETRTAQVEIVNLRAVADDEAVRAVLQLRHFLAVHGHRDCEAGTDGAVDGLAGSGGAAACRPDQCCHGDGDDEDDSRKTCVREAVHCIRSYGVTLWLRWKMLS